MRRTGLIAAAAIIVLVLGSSVAFAVSMAGTIGADALNDTAQADKLSGSDGADTISGLGGNDELYGDSGNDKLFDGFGKDLTSGGAGDDFLNALDLQGGDTLNCGTGADRWVADWNDIVQANCKPPQ